MLAGRAEPSRAELNRAERGDENQPLKNTFHNALMVMLRVFLFKSFLILFVVSEGSRQKAREETRRRVCVFVRKRGGRRSSRLQLVKGEAHAFLWHHPPQAPTLILPSSFSLHTSQLHSSSISPISPQCLSLLSLSQQLQSKNSEYASKKKCGDKDLMLLWTK